MSIWWFNPEKSPDTQFLYYGLTVKRMEKAEEVPGGDGKKHLFILNGLLPEREYVYRIPSQGDRVYRFVTGPQEDSGKGFRFLCFGDTGNTKEGGDSFSYHAAIRLVSDSFYRGIGKRPGFMLHLGDLVKTGKDLRAWEAYFETEKEYCSKYPCMITIGNHEYLEDLGANFKYFFSHPMYYSFEYGDAIFLVIHPFDGICKSFDGPIVSTGNEQYRFIRNELATSIGKKWIIVSIHIPPLSTGDYNHNEVLLEQYFNLFKEHGVSLVLSGHDHSFDSFMVNEKGEGKGSLYIVSGTGGSFLDSFIMARRNKKWKEWFHDRDSKGLYQNDILTERHHRYGELSWGFLDIQVDRDTLTVSYYRWLGFDRFLAITGQKKDSWQMVPIQEKVWRRERLTQVELVRRFIVKK